jgi:rSAM/selenodomain-associated transferase 2
VARTEPSLGVVVPTLDERARIGQLVERLLRAGDRADAVVVADGGSRDGTGELAAERGARVVHAPRGRGTQLARGAGELDTDLLLFLHADCTPGDGALARLRTTLSNGGVHAAALSQRIDAPGWFYRAVEACADRRVDWLGLVYGDSGLCVRRDVYLAVGGFRALPLFEDIDLSRRLRRVTRPRRVDDALIHVSPRRWQREGALRATLRNWMLLAAYHAGVDPRTLARFYPPNQPGSPHGTRPS